MKFIKSVGYALKGVRYCYYSERNFRVELIIASVTFLFGIVVKIKANEWLTILFCTALVLSLEMINTAIEKLLDIVNPSTHPVIKLVKDTAAGAVFLVSIISFITGSIIFLPKIEIFIKYFK